MEKVVRRERIAYFR